MKPHILVGADPFPPYQYLQEDGSLTGLDYNRVVRLFARAGYQAEVELHPWSVLQERLDKGTLHAVFQVQPTPERLARYHFSQCLRQAATELITCRKGLQLTGYDAIPTQGLTLGIIQGYTNGPEIDSLPAAIKQAYPDAETLLRAIHTGQVDAGVFDQGVKQYLTKKLGLTGLFPVEGMTFLRPLYVMFRDPALCAAFDGALAEEASGTSSL